MQVEMQIELQSFVESKESHFGRALKSRMRLRSNRLPTPGRYMTRYIHDPVHNVEHLNPIK